MNSFWCLLFIFAVNGFGSAVSKLLLTVYYESNCPDSKSFVLQQLLPAMLQLHEHVRMQFVPFGKATSTDYGFGGFECQRGFEECFGNMVQDCTLEILTQHGASDLEKLNYIACEMDTYSGSKGDYACVEYANVQPEKVQYCIEYGRGTMLQLDSEYRTSLVEPKFIPTVTFDKVFDQRIQNDSLHDLMGTICSRLRHTVPCLNHFNKSAWTAIMYRTPTQSTTHRQ